MTAPKPAMPRPNAAGTGITSGWPALPPGCVSAMPRRPKPKLGNPGAPPVGVGSLPASPLGDPQLLPPAKTGTDPPVHPRSRSEPATEVVAAPGVERPAPLRRAGAPFMATLPIALAPG